MSNFSDVAKATVWDGANLSGITLYTDGYFGAGDSFKGAVERAKISGRNTRSLTNMVLREADARAVLAELEASGLSMAAFCRKNSMQPTAILTKMNLTFIITLKIFHQEQLT